MNKTEKLLYRFAAVLALVIVANVCLRTETPATDVVPETEMVTPRVTKFSYGGHSWLLMDGSAIATYIHNPDCTAVHKCKCN